MVGFEKNRLVDVSEKEMKTYSCGICFEILKDPKVMTCCRNTFCYECVNPWIKVNKNCPLCRHSASSSSLSEPPLLLINYIQDFSIQCNFKDKGCDSVVKIEVLNAHEFHCNFNPNKQCTECEFVGHENHDCLTELKAKYRTLLEVNEMLKDAEYLDEMVLDSAKQALLAGKTVGWHFPEENNAIPDLLREKIIGLVKNKLEEGVDCDNFVFDIHSGLRLLDESQEWSVSWYILSEFNHSAVFGVNYLMTLDIGQMFINISSITK